MGISAIFPKTLYQPWGTSFWPNDLKPSLWWSQTWLLSPLGFAPRSISNDPPYCPSKLTGDQRRLPSRLPEWHLLLGRPGRHPGGGVPVEPQGCWNSQLALAHLRPRQTWKSSIVSHDIYMSDAHSKEKSRQTSNVRAICHMVYPCRLMLAYFSPTAKTHAHV